MTLLSPVWEGFFVVFFFWVNFFSIYCKLCKTSRRFLLYLEAYFSFAWGTLNSLHSLWITHTTLGWQEAASYSSYSSLPPCPPPHFCTTNKRVTLPSDYTAFIIILQVVLRYHKDYFSVKLMDDIVSWVFMKHWNQSRTLVIISFAGEPN